MSSIDWGLLYRGEQNMNNILPEAIILLGKSGVGKSCLFNLILNKMMIGVNQAGTVSYVPQLATDPSISRMSSSITSETLIPFIKELDQTSICDIPGYDQNRSESDVIHVSYFLQILFEKVKKMKLLLVIQHSELTKRTEWLQTLTKFMDLLNYASLTQSIKADLINSVSIVITRAKGTHQHYTQLLKSKGEEMKNKPLRIPNKEEVVDFINKITNSSRIYAFEQAKEGEKSPPKSDLLAKLNQLGWKNFDMASNKATLKAQNKELVVLPFKKDFQKLQEEEKKKITDSLTKKIENVTQKFRDVVTIFLEELIQNWNQAHNKYQDQINQFNKTLKRNSKFMKELNNFLALCYANYDSQTLMEALNFQIHSEVLLHAAIDSTINMSSIFNQSVPQNYSIEQKLIFIKEKILQVIKMMKPLCLNQQETNKLKKVAFVIKRTVQEFITFYKIQQSLLHDLHIELKDRINSALQNAFNYSSLVMSNISFSF